MGAVCDSGCPEDSTVAKRPELNISPKSCKKMYVAVGRNGFDAKALAGSIPKNSPYLQTALVFFAEDLNAARKHAKMMTLEPVHIQQIGRINVDVSGSKINDDSKPKGIQEFHVMDRNDTDEGCTVHTEAEACYLFDHSAVEVG
jgi:hypothetical protein